ncbi:MAG: hypothetical protein J0I81_14455 [Hyphomicrobium sp.]|nr:hypothetical protein [Hyphomicrobium sp.]
MDLRLSGDTHWGRKDKSKFKFADLSARLQNILACTRLFGRGIPRERQRLGPGKIPAPKKNVVRQSFSKEGQFGLGQIPMPLWLLAFEKLRLVVHDASN